jgi:hypothetical protein
LAFLLAQNKKVGLALKVLEEIQEPFRSALIRHPALNGADVPDLVDDRILLQSRANLLDYADQEALTDERREHLWKKYETDYRAGIERAPASERRRQAPLRVREWRLLDESELAAARQPRLFSNAN